MYSACNASDVRMFNPTCEKNDIVRAKYINRTCNLESLNNKMVCVNKKNIAKVSVQYFTVMLQISASAHCAAVCLHPALFPMHHMHS